VSHLAFQSRDAGSGPIEVDCDVVVVGSGAGGAAAAERLSQEGLSVCVVEAGAWREPEHLPADFYGALRDVYDDWQSGLTAGPALWPVVQARTVGGTTVLNSAICVRTPARVIRDWAREQHLDEAVLARELERHQDAVERALGVQDTVGATLGENDRRALRAALAQGVADPPMRRFVHECEATARCMMGCRRGRKQSVDRALLPGVLERGGTVLSCAPVRRVELQGTRAVGVSGHFRHPRTRARGRAFRVSARRAVVVAASATRTPLLLRRSGIRHRALGRGFRSHPGGAVLAVYDDPIDLHRGATQGWASMGWSERGYKLETLSLPLELLAARLPGAGTHLTRRLARTRHLGHFALGLNAQASGRVRAGLGGRPLIRYALTRHDLERLREGLHLLARMHVDAGARTILPGIAGLPGELAPDEIDAILTVPLQPRRFTCILSHLFGGAVVGGNPDTSVCDPDGRVRGTRGLWVACAAGIPTTLGVNPQLTIMALARMRAEAILSQAHGDRASGGSS